MNLRVLLGLSLGAAAATLGALFLGEYEFDEMLPIVAGPLLGLIIAEITVSVGGHRSPTLAAIVATFAATAVLLAGGIDANDVEPIKPGAYLSAALAAAAAAARGNRWFGRPRQVGSAGDQSDRSAMT